MMGAPIRLFPNLHVSYNLELYMDERSTSGSAAMDQYGDHVMKAFGMRLVLVPTLVVACFGVLLVSQASAQQASADIESLEKAIVRVERNIAALQDQLKDLKRQVTRLERDEKTTATIGIMDWYRATVEARRDEGRVVRDADGKAKIVSGGSAVDFDSMIKSIQTHVDPESWDVNGGEGHIEPFSANLSLVIINDEKTVKKTVEFVELVTKSAETLKAGGFRFSGNSDQLEPRAGDSKR